MATVTNWNPFGVSLNITATSGTVIRTSPTQYTVKITASWETYYSGAYTNYGMKASSGGSSVTLNRFGNKTGSGWGSFTGTYSISGNGSATKTITVTFENYNSDYDKSATKNVTFNVTVPAWPSYTVTYNANGGSGAPASQTKWKDQTLTLSSIKPTRTGYSFLGWSPSKTATTATYSAGGAYNVNSAVILYAVWKTNEYTIKYNANGGTGAPIQQTKKHGVTLKLSTTIPTKTNYDFLGWATSASATTAKYAAGSNYTADSAITLYAVWKLAYVKPKITNFTVSRCDTDGNITDQGTNVSVKFDYEICQYQELSSITIAWKNDSSETESVSGYGDDFGEGSLNMIIGENGAVDQIDGIITDTDSYVFDPEKTYTLTVTVADGEGYAAEVVTLPGTKFIIDIMAGGNGIAFNKPSELEGVMDIGFQTRLFGGLMHPYLEPKTDLDDIRTPNTYIGANVSTFEYRHCPLTSGTFALEVIGMGEDGQVKQRLTYCDKTAARAWERIYYGGSWNYNEADDPTGGWVCVSDFDGQLLWSNAYYMSDIQTAVLSEPVSKQRTGIVLVFSLYDSENKVEKDQEIFEFFIPKYTIQLHEGKGRNFNLCGMFGNGVKYLYLWNDRIEGSGKNSSASMTVGGITYDNTRYVLRHVIGV